MVLSHVLEKVAISGQVNSKERNPIAYVNIGIPGTSVEGIIKTGGHFEINVPACNLLITYYHLTIATWICA